MKAILAAAMVLALQVPRVAASEPGMTELGSSLVERLESGQDVEELQQAILARAKKVVAFGAAGPDEITGSLESEGHGLFTYHFLKGLNGAAQDGAGAVTVRSLYDYLARQVPEGARRDNREQMPQLTPSSGPSTSLRLR